jgi:dCTP deaminase
VIENVLLENINAASIDLTLGPVIHIEIRSGAAVDLQAKGTIRTIEIDIGKRGYYDLEPGEFVLAQTEQVFHLPAGNLPMICSGEQTQRKLDYHPAIAAEFKLKSSLARAGLGHLLAGWADPGWTGSVLTLELKNETRYHHLRLTPGMKIGQVVLWSGPPVPTEASYATRGQYNNDLKATPNKGLR